MRCSNHIIAKYYNIELAIICTITVTTDKMQIKQINKMPIPHYATIE